MMLFNDDENQHGMGNDSSDNALFVNVDGSKSFLKVARAYVLPHHPHF